jgi:CHAT domain-containing protein
LKEENMPAKLKSVSQTLLFVIVACLEIIYSTDLFSQQAEVSFVTASDATSANPEKDNETFSAKPDKPLNEERLLEIINQADKLYQQRKYQECLDVTGAVLYLFDEEEDLSNKLYGKLLVITGSALSESGRWESAHGAFSKALMIFQHIGEKNSVAIIHFNIGRTYGHQKMWNAMSNSYEQALKLFKQLKNTNGQVMVLINLAFAFSSQGELSLATEKLQEIKKLEPRITSPELKPFIAKLDALLVPLDRNRPAPEQVPEVLSDDESRAEWSLLLEHLKNASMTDKGIIAIKIGSEIAIINGPPNLGLIPLDAADARFLNLILNDTRLDDPSVRMQFLQAAKGFAERGVKLRQLNKYSLAWGHYRVALMTAVRYCDIDGLKAVSGSLLTLWRILQKQAVEGKFGEPLSEKGKTASLLRRWISYDAGEVLSALQVCQEETLPVLSVERIRHRLSLMSGEYQLIYKQTMKFYKMASEAGYENLGLEALLLTIAETDKLSILGIPDEHAPERSTGFQQIWSTYLSARRKLPLIDQSTDLYLAYKVAIEYFEYLRARSVSAGGSFGHRLSFLVSEFLQPVYRDRVLILSQHGDPTDSLVAAEYTLSRALTDWMARSHRSNRLIIRQGMAGSVGETRPATLTEIYGAAKRLHADLLYYIRTPGGYRLWLVSQEGNVIDASIEEPIEQIQAIISQLPYSSKSLIEFKGTSRGVQMASKNGAVHSIDAALEKLYRALIPANISRELEKNRERRIILIPDSTLNYIPFSALRIHGQYLIETREVAVIPSVGAWLLIESEANVRKAVQVEFKKSEAFVLGNPTFPENGYLIGSKRIKLGDLPGSEREAKSISELFNIAPMLGSRATLHSVVTEGYKSRIIHLATHGVLMPHDPWNSFLAFTDDVLTTRMLYEFDRPFRVDLVVLSACETALGLGHPDSIVSLSNSFLVAGANSVLSSLWLVPDSATSQLMTKFYEELRSGNTFAGSLREAQISLIRQSKTHHPYWWSAFRLNGDPTKIVR